MNRGNTKQPKSGGGLRKPKRDKTRKRKEGGKLTSRETHKRTNVFMTKGVRKEEKWNKPRKRAKLHRVVRSPHHKTNRDG